MSRVALGQVVYVTYVIQDEQGLVLEQSDLPVGYVHGVAGPLFPQIERALAGKSPGDSVEVTLSPKQAFGPHRPELTFTDDLDNVPDEFRYVGAQVAMENERGEPHTFTVSHIGNGKLTVDGNHPFAGKTLRYRVKVDSVREATKAERASGIPAEMQGH